jgi:hypothetical protein
MGSAAPAFSIVWFAAGCIALPGCEGKSIRLGDALAGGGGMAGFAASAGQGFGSGGAAGVVTGGTGGSAGAAPCPHAEVAADEVVWIGDTWITIPGTQHTLVRDYAREAKAIGADEDYVVPDSAQPFQSMAAIADQYRAERAASDGIKVLIMDGGTWDTIQGNGSEASAQSAGATFEALLSEIAADGSVEHVIYYLMPELPGIPGVALLRPLVQQACADSAVPCHFINLQDVWQAEFTDASGIQASVKGAQQIADAVWSTMQTNCIAQ